MPLNGNKYRDSAYAAKYRENRRKSLLDKNNQKSKLIGIDVNIIKGDEEEVKIINEQRSNEENRESSIEGNNEEQQASESPENTEKGQENNPIPNNNPFIFSSQTRLDNMDESEWIDSVLVIVNVRLGMEKIATEYHSSIIALT